MKHFPVNRKTSRQNPSFSQNFPVADPNGVSLSPPTYGIDFLDRQQKNFESKPNGQKAVIQNQIASEPHTANPGYNEIRPLQRVPPSRPLQAKLMVAPAADQYEQEADRLADEVVQHLNAPIPLTPQQTQPIQRKTTPQEKEELKMTHLFQRRPTTGCTPATPELEHSIQEAHGRGQPIAHDLREPMERAFGANFGNVRVHTDVHADQMNRSIRAKAFTMGPDIFFRQTAYEPGSRDGQALLAHELSHVVQQRENIVQRKIGFELETAIPVSKYIPGEDANTLTDQTRSGLSEQLAADSVQLLKLGNKRNDKTRVTGHTPFLVQQGWHATTDNAGERIGKASDANLEMVTRAAEIETTKLALESLTSAQGFVKKICDKNPQGNRVRIDGDHVYGLPSQEVLEQLYKDHENKEEILNLFDGARTFVKPDAMVQVNIGVALSHLPGLLFEKQIEFGQTSAARNPLVTRHEERENLQLPTPTKDRQLKYAEMENNIYAIQKGLLKGVVEYKSLAPYKDKAYWADICGWISLLINVLTRAAYFPYSNLFKKMTPILSKSPLDNLFQRITTQEKKPNVKKKLRVDVKEAVLSGLFPWLEEVKAFFNAHLNYVFARTRSEEPDFFANFSSVEMKAAAGDFFELGLTVDEYLTNLLSAQGSKDSVTEAILHIKPVKGESQVRSSVIIPDTRTLKGQKEENIALAVLELRKIDEDKFWPLVEWADYALPYIVAAEKYSRRKTLNE